MSGCEAEYSIRVTIRKLPEGVWLATSKDLPGLGDQAPTRHEALDAARAVAHELLESYCQHGSASTYR
jgi:predicted RNase H-like HicB family nuclease